MAEGPAPPLSLDVRVSRDAETASRLFQRMVQTHLLTPPAQDETLGKHLLLLCVLNTPTHIALTTAHQESLWVLKRRLGWRRRWKQLLLTRHHAHMPIRMADGMLSRLSTMLKMMTEKPGGYSSLHSLLL
eukprot:Gregarina_sp_Poly_1__10265@NODE_719_length_6614_cov_137_436383_g541_i0_p6_GENE_NODE_719_length_6614_cov_137_436383_g541_i0NODE_719_length_6614_cov_137_436383_g541_i0_p6_ORF_typecomplete_len130_score20_05TetR_C_35/PF18556_1/0_075_NODE_719_length_6614_cov_137_436383_g541_i025782967